MQRRGLGGVDVVEAVAVGEADVAVPEGVPVVVVAPQEDAVGGDAARQKERQVVVHGAAVARVAGQVGQAPEGHQGGLVPVGGAPPRGVDEAVGALHEGGRAGVVHRVGARGRVEGGHEQGRRLGAVAVGAVRDQGVRVAPQGGQMGGGGGHRAARFVELFLSQAPVLLHRRAGGGRAGEDVRGHPADLRRDLRPGRGHGQGGGLLHRLLHDVPVRQALQVGRLVEAAHDGRPSLGAEEPGVAVAGGDVLRPLPGGVYLLGAGQDGVVEAVVAQVGRLRLGVAPVEGGQAGGVPERPARRARSGKAARRPRSAAPPCW